MSQRMMLAAVAIALTTSLWNPATGQGFLEKLEQKVRDGLKVPGDNPAGSPKAPGDTATAGGAGTVQVPMSNPPPILGGNGVNAAPTGDDTANPNVNSNGSLPGAPLRPRQRPLDVTPEPAVLGLELEELTTAPGGGLTVTSVTPRSPAEAAGFRAGDVLTMLDNRPVLRLSDVKEIMGSRRPGERITLRLRRDGQLMETTALLASGGAAKPVANPAGAPAEQPRPEAATGFGARLGVEVDDVVPGEGSTPVQRGAVVISVLPNSAADASGLKVGDVIVALDGKLVTGVRTMLSAMATVRPGQQVEVSYYAGQQLFRKSMPAAGPEGQLPAGVLAELRKQYAPAAATAGEVGIGGWLGGIGKMFGSSGSQNGAAAGAAPAAGANNTGTPVSGAVQGNPGASVTPGDGAQNITANANDMVPASRSDVSPEALANENAQLRSTVQQLEQRIAELERRLNSLPAK